MRLCIWEKTNPPVMNGEYLWISSIECCIYARNKNQHLMNIVIGYEINPVYEKIIRERIKADIPSIDDAWS